MCLLVKGNFYRVKNSTFYKRLIKKIKQKQKPTNNQTKNGKTCK